MVPALGEKVCALPEEPWSAKLIFRLLWVAFETPAAEPPVNAPLAKVTVRLPTSLAFAWLAAAPVKLSSAVVALVRVSTAVRPAGTLVTLAADSRLAPSVPVKVSPVSVMVILEPAANWPSKAWDSLMEPL